MKRPTLSSSQHLARAAGLLAICLALGACKNGGETPSPGEPVAADPAAVTDEAKPAETPAKPTPAAEKPAPTEIAAPHETPPPAEAPAKVVVPVVDDGTNALPTQVAPGDIVRTTKPRTPEYMIQQVLVASLEPDEEKGWQLFKSLLHADELHPNGLITRRSMNFAASRRKVDLFIVEKADLPVFKVSRILDEGDGTLRFFLHNPESMPTPCTARIDESLTPPAWRIGLCSL